MAVSEMTLLDVLTILGAPKMAWHDLWTDENIQSIYSDLRNHDERLQPRRYKYKTNSAIWKSAEFVAQRLSQEPSLYFSHGHAGGTDSLSRSDMLCYSVKELLSRCRYIPAFGEISHSWPDFEDLSTDRLLTPVRAALILLQKIAITCKGRRMDAVRVRGRKKVAGPVDVIEQNWVSALVRDVDKWLDDGYIAPEEITGAVVDMPEMEEPPRVFTLTGGWMWKLEGREEKLEEIKERYYERGDWGEIPGPDREFYGSDSESRSLL